MSSPTLSTEPAADNPRAEIDAIDLEILRLLNKRFAVALRVGAHKFSSEASLCDPNRERAVLTRLRAENNGPLDDHAVENIFGRIIDESLLLQQRTYGRSRREDAEDSTNGVSSLGGNSRIAFLGDRGTFSEQAALGIKDDGSETVSMPTFEQLFTAIDDGKADFILTPLENSLIGSVQRCVDLLLESDLHIAADVVLPVSHYLIAPEGATIESIRTVESHPAALAQCRRFFAAHPHIKSVPADDTAGSVRRAVEGGDVTRAALGAKRAADIYGGVILREHLEDSSENFTRFALLSAEPSAPSGSKISVVVRLKNRPGSLHDVLRPLVRRSIDLAKIESFPVRHTPGEFNFYLDINAPANEADLEGALGEIREQAVSLRMLGRYSTTRLG
jgi:chorismate mutase/prephenate dehydratase